MKRLPFRLLSIFILSLLFVACGGGADGDDDDNTGDQSADDDSTGDDDATGGDDSTGDDDATHASLGFQLQHLVNCRKRLAPCRFDEAARIDQDEIGTVRIIDKLVSVKL